jgi:O-antigen/teichoic acid export membrane protein
MDEAVAPRVTRARTGRDIAAQLVLRSANLALGLVTTVVLVRALGDTGFGQWATVLAVLGLAGSFGLIGLNNVAVERAAAEPQRAPAWIGALVTLRVLLSPPLTVVSLVICLALADTTAMRVAAAVVHTALLTSALASARIAFQLRVRNDLTSAIELSGGVAWLGAVTLVAVLDGGLIAIGVAFAAVQNVTNLVLLWLAFRVHPIRLRGGRSLWSPLLRLGLPVGLASLVALGYARVGQIFVFQLAGAGEAGLYGAARRIYEPLQFLPGSIMTTLFPLLVAARAAGTAQIARLFNKAIDYLLLVSLPALTISLAGPEAIAVTLFGTEFAKAGEALPVLMAAFVLISIGHLSGYLIIAYGLQRRFVLVTLLALAFTVAANLALVPDHGFMAAVWVTLGTELIVVGLSMAMVCRRMRVVPTGARVGRIAASAVAAGALAWALRQAGAPVPVWAGVAGAAYPLLLLAFGGIRTEDLRALLERRSVTPADAR